MDEPVVERPALPDPATPAFIAALLQVFQQYGYRLNRTITRNGGTAMTAPLPLASFAEADLPDATSWEGAIVYVNDGASGERFRGSDGTSWVNLG